jgi:hypothetical protein
LHHLALWAKRPLPPSQPRSTFRKRTPSI